MTRALLVVIGLVTAAIGWFPGLADAIVTGRTVELSHRLNSAGTWDRRGWFKQLPAPLGLAIIRFETRNIWKDHA